MYIYKYIYKYKYKKKYLFGPNDSYITIVRALCVFSGGGGLVWHGNGRAQEVGCDMATVRAWDEVVWFQAQTTCIDDRTFIGAGTDAANFGIYLCNN